VDWGGDVVDAVFRFRWPPDRPVERSARDLLSDPRVGSPGCGCRRDHDTPRFPGIE